MLSGETLSKYTARNLAIWWTLAFQAGAINVGGYLACHRFVTHTTGFATLFGTDLAKGQAASALGMLSVPLFFLAGAMVSALLVDRRKLRQQPPRFALALALIAGILLLITVAGQLGHFGVFGEPLLLARDYALLALLSFVSGVQNAMITSMSGSVLRTTHLTGLTTDLAIGLVRLFSNEHKHSRQQERQATTMRLGIILSFVLGSTVAAWIFLHGHYWGFLLPATLASALWLATLQHPKEPHVSMGTT